ncbi:hypothetical protein PHLCEN_2v3279 [Hermanssonia centrifuga]|uniref:Uncharacterized protein n=1 Tax=Hermanssonia centrifuga TaxID=98765 RepID=A0A2R6QUH3_9APHY|nr:hypothetical protein PHLCEN_2v3279 [Hermanssonia centrifuga]
MDDKFLLRAAFKAASDTGTFMDTKFYAFSRRDSSGRAYEPKTIYANGWMLRTRLPSYFEPRGYKESSVGPFHANFPTDQQAFNNDYGYDCDSDLEEYEGREDHTPIIMDSSPENCTIGETSRQDVEAPRRQKDSDDGEISG